MRVMPNAGSIVHRDRVLKFVEESVPQSILGKSKENKHVQRFDGCFSNAVQKQ